MFVYDNIVGIFSALAGFLSILIGLGILPGTRMKKKGYAAYRGRQWDMRNGSKIMILCGIVMIGLGVAHALFLKK